VILSPLMCPLFCVCGYPYFCVLVIVSSMYFYYRCPTHFLLLSLEARLTEAICCKRASVVTGKRRSSCSAVCEGVDESVLAFWPVGPLRLLLVLSSSFLYPAPDSTGHVPLSLFQFF
jgi:hypothetical protein